MSFVGGCLDGRSVERRCASGGCRLFWGLVVGLGVRQLELRGSSFHPRQGLPRTRQTDPPMGWKFSLIGIPVESPPDSDTLAQRRVGCADEGDMIVEGQPFEWEATHQEDGWFEGEGAVFSFLAPLLGAPFDQTPDEFFETPFREYAKPKGKGLLSRLFGR